MSLPRTLSEIHYTYDHEKYSEKRTYVSANGLYDSCAVATDSNAGSNVGKKILEQDGSAVDAAIACLLCNSLTNAQSMGIGGGFFMLHYSQKDNKITAFDARETAPAASSYDMFNNKSKTKGGLSVAVPGELRGYWKAHKMFGNLKWNKLFQPAIEMCNNGFQLPQSQARYLRFCESKILDSATMREVYFNRISNELYKANSIIRRPKLAKTFEIIAKEGESAFYNGCLTDTILEEVNSKGGILTKADLQSYECLVKEPVSYKLRNNTSIHSVPSPSCGILLNFIIAILDSFDDHDELTWDCIETNALFNHRFIEASKFAFGLRYLIGDDNVTDSRELYRTLSDRSIIKEYRDRIKDNSIYPLNYYGTNNFISDNGTAHTSIVAPNGDAVAVTSSINLVFGSKIMGEKTNIIYNNQMDDFSAPDTQCNSFSLPNYSINYIAPGKRPVSSMTPLIAVDEEKKNVRLVCGSSGGTRIVTSTALTAGRNLILKRDIVQSVDEPRVHQQLFPDEVLYEDEFNRETLSILSGNGHRLINFGYGGSAVQAIERRNDGRLYAVSDSRKGGVPSGF